MSQFDPTKHAWSGLERAVRRVFPERQFLLRSGDNVHWVQFSTRRQLVAAFCVVAVAAWGLYTTEQFVSHRQIIRAKDHYISNAYAAYDTLVGQVDQYRTNFESLATELDSNHTSILELATENEQLRKEMAQGAKKGPTLESKLASVENELKKAERKRSELKKQLESDIARIDRDVETLSARRTARPDNVDALDVEVRKVVLQRDLALSERDELNTFSNKLVNQLADMQNTQMLVFNRFADLTNSSIGEIENMLAVTGLDVNRLLAASNEDLAQGGPFIPSEYADLGDYKLNARLTDLNDRIDRWDGLQQLQRTLPVGAPLVNYAVTSFFGNRHDPFNGRMGRHEGVDLGAPMQTLVHAVAPGKVVFTGWKPRYGKTVIIDHGLGFSTLYGHLHSSLVKTGETVTTDTAIAKVGNSGRSTGPHLHYEVRVNDIPRNPLKFMKASRYVFKG